MTSDERPVDPPAGLITDVALAIAETQQTGHEPDWRKYAEAAYAAIAPVAHAAGRRDGLVAAWNIFHARHADNHCWQCSGCRGVFFVPWKRQCPTCGRTDYWSGSVDPVAKEKARALLAGPGEQAGGRDAVSVKSHGGRGRPITLHLSEGEAWAALHSLEHTNYTRGVLARPSPARHQGEVAVKQHLLGTEVAESEYAPYRHWIGFSFDEKVICGSLDWVATLINRENATRALAMRWRPEPTPTTPHTGDKP